MTIGMRNIKTAIAVFLCILISRLLKLEYPFFASIAAIIAMQSSVTDSFKAGRDRMLGTTVGALIGLICALIMPGNALLCGIGMVLVIYICNLLKWNKSISIAGIVFLAIMINLNGKNPFLYSANRLLDTLIGVSVAVLVNYFILPPDNLKTVTQKCDNLIDEILDLIQEKILYKNDINIDKINIDTLSLEVKLNMYINDHKSKKENIEEINRLRKILNVNKDIYSHLKILSEFKEELCLNEINIKLLESLYNEKINFNEYVKTDENIIFNYHIEKILKDLYIIKDMKFSNYLISKKPSA